MLIIGWIVVVVVIGLCSIPVRYCDARLTGKVACAIALCLIGLLKV